MYKSTTQQWRSYQWVRRFIRRLEMDYSLSEHTVRFTDTVRVYPNESNKPGYGQLCIFDFAEETAKRLESKAD
jgi:hypothetical protein